jgi:FdhD protein
VPAVHRPLTGTEATAAQIDGRAAPTSLLRPGDGAASDLVALEEPLEIRIAGETVGVLMRTPGDDHRLALGFLFSEGIVQSASEFSAVYHCGRPGDEAYGSAIELAPASDARIDWERIDGTKRSFASSSACGVCGRRAVEDLVAGLVAPEPIAPIPAALVGEKVAALRDHQPVFTATGGTHVAALWTRDGTLIAAHEDVGRHNAVDKVVGALLLARAEAPAGSPGPTPAVLTVSSRAGLEIVQKAARARIPIVATVSAPTSLAIELARASGLTLAGFVRPGRMNVYAGAERLSGL